MDMLTPIALIGFLAQVIIWLGLPDGARETASAPVLAEVEPLAA